MVSRTIGGPPLAMALKNIVNVFNPMVSLAIPVQKIVYIADCAVPCFVKKYRLHLSLHGRCWSLKICFAFFNMLCLTDNLGTFILFIFNSFTSMAHLRRHFNINVLSSIHGNGGDIAIERSMPSPLQYSITRYFARHYFIIRTIEQIHTSFLCGCQCYSFNGIW